MVPVLLLCIAVFAINAGFHVLAIVGGLQRLSGSSAIALFAGAPSKPDGGDIPLADLLQAPYFFTAFMLCFSTCALVASHSAVLIHNNPFGFDEP